MRRGLWIGVVILAVLAAVGIGIGAYHAGFTNGLAENGRVEVVRVVGHGWGYHGGFPFGLLFFPLVILGIVLTVRGLAWRRWSRWGGGPAFAGQGHQHGGRGGPWMFEDWHRRMHEPPAGGGPEPPAGTSG